VSRRRKHFHAEVGELATHLPNLPGSRIPAWSGPLGNGSADITQRCCDLIIEWDNDVENAHNRTITLLGQRRNAAYR
jgi:hypothetical protein